MKNPIRLSIVLAGLLGAGLAQAQSAYEFTSPGNSFSNGSWDFGWTFSANQDVVVSGLGYYADPTNGFVDGNEVALYDSTGTLLASATVTNLFPLTGHFRYVTIAPITLLAGHTYQVDGVSHGNNYTWNDAGFTTNSAITYVSNSWVNGTSTPDFQSAVKTDTSFGYHGPNVFLGEPVFTGAVPEPETYAMMLAGLGVVGLIVRRRKQTAA